MLAVLPPIARILLLGLAGALIGQFINWAIYSWPYFLRRAISPWMTPDAQASPRTTADRIPIVGWFLLRRDRTLHGTGFWIRPLVIEIVWVIGLPWFYHWLASGGLTGGPVLPVPANWNSLVETWFVAQTILVAFLFIATFIDFDERTIPDFVTIPGTLIALALAASFPAMRLPEVLPAMAGAVLQPVHFASPKALPNFHHEIIGLIIGLAIFTIWILALLPKISTLRYGLVRGISIMIASVLRPRRKTQCAFRTVERRPFATTFGLAGLWLLGMVAIVLAKMVLPVQHWDSLFGSLIGLAFGGGMVWAIRIVARHAMQQEAMGFGDVTLMAMIGAFLGWQAALLTFAIAPFAALLIVVVCFVITKENELAFGPYLCFGCVMLLAGWATIWPAMAGQFFFLGPFLLILLLVALVLMAVLLIGIQFLKRILFGTTTNV